MVCCWNMHSDTTQTPETTLQYLTGVRLFFTPLENCQMCITKTSDLRVQPERFKVRAELGKRQLRECTIEIHTTMYTTER